MASHLVIAYLMNTSPPAFAEKRKAGRHGWHQQSGHLVVPLFDCVMFIIAFAAFDADRCVSCGVFFCPDCCPFLASCRESHPTGPVTWTPQHDATQSRSRLIEVPQHSTVSPGPRARCLESSSVCFATLYADSAARCWAGGGGGGRWGSFFLFCHSRLGGCIRRCGGLADDVRILSPTCPPFAHCPTHVCREEERSGSLVLLLQLAATYVGSSVA